MKTFLWGLLSLVFLMPVRAAEDIAKPEAVPKKVYVIPVREDIMPPLLYVVRRGVKEAMAAKADLLVIDMDTNGGRLDVAEEIMGILDKFEGQIVTFVNKKAISAGAIISFATDRIYMAPQGLIGDAAPVMSGGADIPETANEKVKSFLSAKIRSYAEANGHRGDVAEAMVRMERTFEIDGEVLADEGELLTLTNTEAEKEYGDPPKPLLSSGTVANLEELFKKLNVEVTEKVEVEPTGAEKLARWINAIAPILMMIGIAGIYIEYKTPGFGVFGVIGILAFLIYFFGGYVAGLSGIEWLVVFFLGIVLIGIELFVFPGTIVVGLGGIGMVLLALVMSGVDMYPDMSGVPSIQAIGVPMQNLMVAFLGGILICYGLSKVLPHTSYYGLVVSQGASGVTSVAAIEEKKKSRVGEIGTAVSQLRPSGKARFGDEILDVISSGEIIDSGQAVKILRHSGTDPVVEAV